MNDSLLKKRESGTLPSKEMVKRRYCAKCQNHKKMEALRGHKRHCEYMHCNCAECLNTNSKRALTAEKVRKRRELQADLERGRESAAGAHSNLSDHDQRALNVTQYISAISDQGKKPNTVLHQDGGVSPTGSNGYSVKALLSQDESSQEDSRNMHDQLPVNKDIPSAEADPRQIPPFRDLGNQVTDVKPEENINHRDNYSHKDIIAAERELLQTTPLLGIEELYQFIGFDTEVSLY